MKQQGGQPVGGEWAKQQKEGQQKQQNQSQQHRPDDKPQHMDEPLKKHGDPLRDDLKG